MRRHVETHEDMVGVIYLVLFSYTGRMFSVFVQDWKLLEAQWSPGIFFLVTHSNHKLTGHLCS